MKSTSHSNRDHDSWRQSCCALRRQSAGLASPDALRAPRASRPSTSRTAGSRTSIPPQRRARRARTGTCTQQRGSRQDLRAIWQAHSPHSPPPRATATPREDSAVSEWAGCILAALLDCKLEERLQVVEQHVVPATSPGTMWRALILCIASPGRMWRIAHMRSLSPNPSSTCRPDGCIATEQISSEKCLTHCNVQPAPAIRLGTPVPNTGRVTLAGMSVALVLRISAHKLRE